MQSALQLLSPTRRYFTIEEAWAGPTLVKLYEVVMCQACQGISPVSTRHAASMLGEDHREKSRRLCVLCDLSGKESVFWALPN